MNQVKETILAFLGTTDDSLIAVSTFASLSPTSFAIIGLSETGRWQIIVDWIEGKWVVTSKQPYNDGYYKARGYPSSLALEATGFAKKLYPKQMGEGYAFVSIETKNVGVNIFIRIVYQVKGVWIEVVIKKVYGVKNSNILYSWNIISGLKEKKDYGHGSVNMSMSAPAVPQAETKEVAEPVK